MKLMTLIAAACLTLAGAGLAAAASAGKAVAVLQAAAGQSVAGSITFTAADKGVHVKGRISGLAPGKHGFHVHAFGDCSAADFSSAGGHFNPTEQPHAGPDAAHRHVGDLGNVEAGADGVANLDFVDSQLSFEGASNILGRGVIVHAGVDDLKSQPSGDAGGRVACGVIGAAKAE